MFDWIRNIFEKSRETKSVLSERPPTPQPKSYILAKLLGRDGLTEEQKQLAKYFASDAHSRAIQSRR
jgi:hypothetical protein